MKRKTKIIATTVSAVCVVLVAVGVVFAYMTDSREKDNSFTVGYDSIEIVEDFSPPSQQQQTTIYKKQVQIKNNGNVPCYIRVYADFSDSTVRSRSYFSDSDDISADTYYYSANRDTTDPNSYVNNLPKGWVFIPDNYSDTALAGYYYYTKPVQPNDSTPTLFKYIKTVYTDENEIRQYDVTVYAESVQTVLKDGTQKDGTQLDDYKEVWNDFLS
ncbi:MAG: SipW-dependent-type signal peptide-containing protein [Acutalibacteraceae bacterium]